ncbi:hypothetical protein [Ancylobacter rudongensis]|uniref:Uncharacterized protein n=1 Tax=Ancylobacter rudongensis TaxID=177413 RepID=A0A1G4UQF7_9HYPH|nr:hypothetical protein [Ancylobacter rudongensis]SCW95886.1 hypothetical protein SAMN05660859_0140 [Ancylobacter rudongensis]
MSDETAQSDFETMMAMPGTFVFGENQVAMLAAVVANMGAIAFAHRAKAETFRDASTGELDRDALFMDADTVRLLLPSSDDAIGLIGVIHHVMTKLGESHGFDPEQVMLSLPTVTGAKHAARVTELLNHNNSQLQENRNQRAVIRDLLKALQDGNTNDTLEEAMARAKELIGA